MRPRFGLPQLEFGAAAYDLAPEFDELLEHLEQIQHARTSTDDRQRDDAEGLLQLRVLVQVVENDFAHLAAFELDHDAHAVAVRLVA